MKKLFLFIMLGIMVLTICGCTETTKNDLSTYYDAENKVYYVKNVSSKDYKELKVYLTLGNQNGYFKEVVYEIGTLEMGEEYAIDLKDHPDINRVLFDQYEVFVSPWQSVLGYVLLALLSISLIISTCTN